MTQGKHRREEEEHLWLISILPPLSVLAIVGVYIVDLTSRGVIGSFQAMMTYMLLLVALTLVIGAAIYEIAESFKIERTPSFRIKRFLSRFLYFSLVILYVLSLWQLFTVLFSAFLKVQYILIISLMTMALTLLVLARNPRTRRLMRKLTQEKNS